MHLRFGVFIFILQYSNFYWNNVIFIYERRYKNIWVYDPLKTAGCKTYLTGTEQLKDNEIFADLLGYINTNASL